jgi:predicted AAA+ superfamily ATPase
MDLKRKIYDRMLEWKTKRKGKTVLLVEGARRVGKTYICRKFGKAEYKSMIRVDFSTVSKEIKDLIENQGENLDLFFSQLSIYYQTPLHVRESLILFDEIQLFPPARQRLKALVEDGRYDYIETGSLLSIKQNIRDILIPSEEERIEMHPMDFEEFLWAIQDEITTPFLRDCFIKKAPVGVAVHRKVMEKFRQYMLVGGMPQAVLAYLDKNDFEAADDEKKRILELYRNDIGKYAAGHEKRVLEIFDSIPGQLTKAEKKFRLSSIDKNARQREYGEAFMWLIEAMVANRCLNSTDPRVGLALSSDHTSQKLYMADTGLLITHSFRDNEFLDNELYRSILFDKLHVNEGMILENVVAQALRTAGHKLFFYSRNDPVDRKNHMEIDFLIIKNKKVSPLEVKSASYRQHSSLDKFEAKFSKTVGEQYIIYSKDVMIRDGIIHIPAYMTMFL